MAWGVLQPTKSGKFWPRGKLEGLTENRKIGWLDRLRREYLAQPIEVQDTWFNYGDKRLGLAAGHYPFYVAEKFGSERGSRPDPHLALSPPFGEILPHEWPRSYELELRSYRPGELGSMVSVNQVLAVDGKLKSLIENFEPDVHEFYPIEILWQQEPLEFDFHTIFINQYRDSFCPKRSDPAIFLENGKHGFILDQSKAGIEGMALIASAFRGAHLWKERQLGDRGPICLSNELRAAIVDAGLIIPHHHQMKEV